MLVVRAEGRNAIIIRDRQAFGKACCALELFSSFNDWLIWTIFITRRFDKKVVPARLATGNLPRSAMFWRYCSENFWKASMFFCRVATLHKNIVNQNPVPSPETQFWSFCTRF